MFPLFCTSEFLDHLDEIKFKGMCILTALIADLWFAYIKSKTSYITLYGNESILSTVHNGRQVTYIASSINILIINCLLTVGESQGIKICVIK
jgi:hypothetical protein